MQSTITAFISIYIYIHTHKFNFGMHQNIIAVFIWTHIMLNHYHQLHTHQTKSLSSIACIQARLSTPFGSKPYSRLSEPVFPLCRLGSFVVFFIGGTAFWIPTGMCESGRKKQCCVNTHARLQISLTSDKISQPIALGQSVCIWRWQLACVGCLSNSFSIFLLS